MSNFIFIILALVVGFLIAFASTPTVIVLARKIKAIDIPKDSRRIHKKPIPLIGGLAIFYGFLISVLCFASLDKELVGILVGASIMVIVAYLMTNMN